MSEQIKFKRTLLGIKKKSVMSYINSVSKSLEDKLFKKDTEISSLKKEIEKLTENNEKLEKIIAGFEAEKEKISEAIMKADESAKKIVSEAEEKSKEILINLEREKDKINSEFESRITAKKAELSSYKSEINYLREKVKLTLNKFDEILENTVK